MATNIANALKNSTAHAPSFPFHAKSYIISNYFHANMTWNNLGGNIKMESYTPAEHFYGDWLFWFGFILFFGSGIYAFYMTWWFKVHDEGPHVSQNALSNILAIANKTNWLATAEKINVIGFAMLVLFKAAQDVDCLLHVYLLWFVAKNVAFIAGNVKENWVLLTSPRKRMFASRMAERILHCTIGQNDRSVGDALPGEEAAETQRARAEAGALKINTWDAQAAGEKVDQRFDEEIIQVSNRFDNFNNSLGSAIVVFVAQSMLVAVFMRNFIMTLHPESEEDGVEPTRWIGWLMTLPLQILISDQMGDAFFDNITPWLSLWQATSVQRAGTQDISTELEGRGMGWVPLRRWELCLRALMDFIVNNVYMELLMLVFPLALMSQSGEDFVFNSFGVAFITTLDDNGQYDLDKLNIRRPARKWEEKEEEAEMLQKLMKAKKTQNNRPGLAAE